MSKVCEEVTARTFPDTDNFINQNVSRLFETKLVVARRQTQLPPVAFVFSGLNTEIVNFYYAKNTKKILFFRIFQVPKLTCIGERILGYTMGATWCCQ